MIEHPTYLIRKLADFLKVPEARRSICLKEFGSWLKLREPILELLTPPEHPGCVRVVECFTWIDDGERNMRIVIKPTKRKSPSVGKGGKG